MKKRFLTIAIAASLAAPLSAAMAGDADLYGRFHISMDHIEPDTSGPASGPASATENDTSWKFNDRKSAIGVKGSEDLGGGMKAFFKMEWSVDVTGENGTGIGTRDRYIGIKTGMGTMKFGAMTTSWKKTTAWIDPFWHTVAEGRGLIDVSSSLAAGRGTDGGRGTSTFQYSSPKMGGMQMVINRTFSGNQNGENLGIGFRYTTKNVKAFFDYADIKDSPNAKFNTGTNNSGESAIKVGGSYKMGSTTVGAQFEQNEDLENADFMMLSVKHKLNDNDTILFSYGTKDAVVDATATPVVESKAGSHDAIAVGYNHSMSKRTSTYVAYATKGDDAAGANDLDIISLGLKHTF
jgi:predicted porin